MSQFLITELEQQRGRLDYYLQKKNQAEAKLTLDLSVVQSSKKTVVAKSAPETYETWIEIYSERVKKLENQIVKLGIMSREEVKAVQGATTLH